MPLNSKKMNLDYIRTFAVLGQSRNMTEASHKLGVDTSYVSRHIKQLEENLQTKLVILDSKTKETRLTESGQYFFEKYEKIYNEILLVEKNNSMNIKITLGIQNDLEQFLLQEKLQQFSQKNPVISFKIKNGPYDQLFKELLQYSIDFVLCKTRVDVVQIPSNVKWKTLFQSNYCFVYHPLKYSFLDYSNVTCIMLVNGTDEREAINQYVQKNNLVWKNTYEVETFDQMISYVQKGFGIGFALKESIKDYPELKVIDLDCPCDVIIAYQEDNVTPIVQELLDMY
ncbi:MAG: LysR family transcriptional regulator [Bacilli bacterium]|nr:LysR family transcriptional regulator [Bacilli bacterium]